MGPSIKERLSGMIAVLTDALDDADKHAAGNKAAGTRLRVLMQHLKKDASTIRAKVLSDKKAREAG